MSWDKYGSPYDPNYSGKMMLPRDRERRDRERREREQRSICPCGDPACTQHIDGKGGNFGYSDISWSNTSSRADSYMSEMLRISGAYGNEASNRKQGGEPASYTAARKEVAKYIITAPEQAFDDIVGNDAALEQLRDAIQAPVKHKELYKAYGMKMPKGALLSGPPGCGKTMFARAAASEMRKLYGKTTEFISISGSELQSKYVGETEERIKAIFVYAREYLAYRKHPLLVFMDEAEVLLPDRTGRVRRVASWEESQVATFLAEMDGMQQSGAFVLLATNRPNVIDQAVLRDGRCDFKIVVQRPTIEAVEGILRKNFDGVLMGESADLDSLVFAAAESLNDPHKIILHAHAIELDFVAEEIKHHDKHFLLEHIVSGAMAASIPGRAKRYAFARDKADGVARGITVNDVVQAVNDVFEENRTLEHAFALDEFKREFEREARAAA